MIVERAVVDMCAKQKTNIEEEYPQNDGKSKKVSLYECEISKAASEAPTFSF